MNKPRNSAEHLDVVIRPDAEIERTDSSLGKNCGCLSEYQAGTAYRAAAKMNEMPFVSVSVRTRILTHRGDEHAIREFHFPNPERIKQAGHSSFSAGSRCLSLSSYAAL